MFVKNKHLQPNTILYKLKSQIYVIKILNFEGGKIVGCLTYTFSYCSWGSQGKNTEVVCHSLLQWTTFCQTSPP